MNDLKLQLERPNENFNLRMAIRAKTTTFLRGFIGTFSKPW